MNSWILFGTGFVRGQNTVDVKKERPKYIIENWRKKKTEYESNSYEETA